MQVAHGRPVFAAATGSGAVGRFGSKKLVITPRNSPDINSKSTPTSARTRRLSLVAVVGAAQVLQTVEGYPVGEPYILGTAQRAQISPRPLALGVAWVSGSAPVSMSSAGHEAAASLQTITSTDEQQDQGGDPTFAGTQIVSRADVSRLHAWGREPEPEPERKPEQEPHQQIQQITLLDGSSISTALQVTTAHDFLCDRRLRRSRRGWSSCPFMSGADRFTGGLRRSVTR
jgi:hypothetical protein